MSSERHFPITHSVLAGTALAAVVGDAYGLEVARCRLIKAVILATYHVRAGDEAYILRVYPHERRSRAVINEELALLEHRQRQPGVPGRRRDAEQERRRLLVLLRRELRPRREPVPKKE